MGFLSRLACLGLLAALACSSSSSQAPPPAAADGQKQATSGPALGQRSPGEPESAVPVEADDIQVGSPEAPVTVVAFLDFECGFCREGFLTLLALQKLYSPSELRVVLKHLPLDFHPAALPAAVAAQAVQLGAGSEAAFEYARVLFTNQSRIGYVELAQWAEDAGLTRELYNELVQTELTTQRVAADVLQARRLGVDGTPAFFVNGRLLSGAQPIEVFRTVIDEEKAAMTALLAERSRAEAYAERLRENAEVSLAEALLSRDPESYKVPVDGSPAEGPSDAPVTVVLFTDFECPYCKRAEATLAELRRLYPREVRWVFKHKPLPFHPRARPAAWLTAAIAARKGDAVFFKAAEELFQIAPSLGDEELISLGRRHGLTEAEAKSALAGLDVAAKARVERDDDLARDVEVQGTPHFFVNGKRLSGARPLAHFQALIDYEAKRARALLASGITAGALYDTVQKDALSPGAPVRIEKELSEANRATRGPQSAPVVIHVWSDFQCPFCRQAEKVLAELEGKRPGQLRFVWHDLPLDFHERALPAARAGREAFRQKGSQGFWAMHDRLFGLEESGPALEREQVLAHGRALGLNLDKLARAYDSKETPAEIDADVELAAALGIRGTPAFIVGGYLLSGARPVADFERLIELSLKDKAQSAQR